MFHKLAMLPAFSRLTTQPSRQGFLPLALASLLACAQGAAATDLCSPLADPAEPIAGVNGPVTSLLEIDPDGPGPLPTELVLAGTFTEAASSPASRIVRWNGSTWTTLGAGIDNGAVRALAQFDGKIIAAGIFTSAGGNPAANIAAWDGSTWQPMGAGFPNADIFALCVYNNQLIAGGTVPLSSDLPFEENDRIIFHRWTGSTWEPIVPNNQRGFVRTLYVRGNQLLVGGTFYALNNEVYSNILTWDGTNFGKIGEGLDMPPSGISYGDGGVWAFSEYNGQLVAGGDFTRSGLTDIRNAAVFVNGEWQPLGPTGTSGPSGIVQQLRVEGGQLLLAADPSTIDGQFLGQLIAWNGTAFSSFVNSFVPARPANVMALANFRGRLAVAGEIRQIGTQPIFNAATFEAGVWQPLGSQSRFNVPALHWTAFQGDMLAAGTIRTSPGGPVDRIARYRNGVWTNFTPAIPDSNWEIYGLCEHSGQLFAAAAVPNTTSGRVYRLSTDGTSWTVIADLQSLAGGFGISRLVSLPTGLFVVGVFDTVNTLAAKNIARWTGSAWDLSINGAADIIEDVTLFNGELHAAGGFIDLANPFDPAFAVARWNGSEWVQVGGSYYGFGRALAVFNNELYIGGFLSRVESGVEVSFNFGRLISGAWQPIVGVSPFNSVTGLLPFGNSLVLSGDFGSINGLDSGGIALYSPSAGLRRFDVIPAAYEFNVTARPAALNDTLYVGGAFTRIDGRPVGYWGRWSCTQVCTADFDGNSLVQVTDIFVFLNAWFAGCNGTIPGAPCLGRNADINASGSIDVPDIFSFLAQWFAGC